MKASASKPSQSRRFRRDCSPTGRAERVEKVLNIRRHSEPVRNEQLKACVLPAAEAFRAEKPKPLSLGCAEPAPLSGEPRGRFHLPLSSITPLFRLASRDTFPGGEG